MHQAELYSNETTMLSLLTVKTLDWALAVWDTDPQVKTSAHYFAGQICEVFEYPAGGKDISIHRHALMLLRLLSVTLP